MRLVALLAIAVSLGSCGGSESSSQSEASGEPASSAGDEAAMAEAPPPATADPASVPEPTSSATEPESPGADDATVLAEPSDPPDPADPPPGDSALSGLAPIIRRLLQPIRDCYERALARDPDVQQPGFEVETRPDGRMSARIVRSSGDRALDRCVVAAVRRMRVPRDEAPAETVTYPFNFAIQMED